MTRQRFASLLMSLAFGILLNDAIGAEPAAPSLSLAIPARPAVETDQESISLSGSVTSGAPLAAVWQLERFWRRIALDLYLAGDGHSRVTEEQAGSQRL